MRKKNSDGYNIQKFGDIRKKVMTTCFCKQTLSTEKIEKIE
jgi:hypothetical protein